MQTRLQPYLDKIVDEHLDAIAAGPETFDFVEAMSLPIPCLMICELLGVPYEDRDGFHHATVDMMDMAKSKEERDKGAHWLVDYITHLVADKRRTGDTTGILAELINKADGEDSILTERQLIGLGVLLLFAGHDTTAAMMGLSTLTLLTHPAGAAEAAGPAREGGARDRGADAVPDHRAVRSRPYGAGGPGDRWCPDQKGRPCGGGDERGQPRPPSSRTPTPSTSTARWSVTWASATASTPAWGRTSPARS